MVTIGIDTHKATLAVSAIDEAGRERAAETFPNDGEGTRQAPALGPDPRSGATLRNRGLGLVRCGPGAPARRVW
jgi:hypothetical protein